MLTEDRAYNTLIAEAAKKNTPYNDDAQRPAFTGRFNNLMKRTSLALDSDAA